MNYCYDAGGPPGNGQGPAAEARPQSLIPPSYRTAVEKSKIDPWIDWYLEFLDREISVLVGGRIGRRYFHCADAAYAEFKDSRSQESCYRCWMGIRRWFGQLRRYAG